MDGWIDGWIDRERERLRRRENVAKVEYAIG